eukprot:gene13415-biopygen535
MCGVCGVCGVCAPRRRDARSAGPPFSFICRGTPGTLQRARLGIAADSVFLARVARLAARGTPRHPAGALLKGLRIADRRSATRSIACRNGVGPEDRGGDGESHAGRRYRAPQTVDPANRSFRSVAACRRHPIAPALRGSGYRRQPRRRHVRGSHHGAAACRAGAGARRSEVAPFPAAHSSATKGADAMERVADLRSAIRSPFSNAPAGCLGVPRAASRAARARKTLSAAMPRRARCRVPGVPRHINEKGGPALRASRRRGAHTPHTPHTPHIPQGDPSARAGAIPQPALGRGPLRGAVSSISTTTAAGRSGGSGRARAVGR